MIFVDEIVFVSRIQKLRRIVIPKLVCEEFDVNEGDTVEVKIKKLVD